MERRVVILADDSAHWKIAGLRQLERLALEIKEWAALSAETAEIFIDWSPSVAPVARFLPRHPRLTPGDFVSTPNDIAEFALGTRIFLHRNGALEAAATRPPEVGDDWEILEDPMQVPACEKRFLRGAGKAQDGLVSRFLNRPISRAITRALLHTSITPSGWTLLIFILPLVGSVFLAHGRYADIVLGLLFFQLYSILDGCDGEIARAKHLASPRGAQLDTWCDTVGNLLMVLTLGSGLGRLGEGIAVALLIATNELLLAFPARSARETPADPAAAALYPRQRHLLDGGRLFFFGERFTATLLQLTKRDVALVAFLLLALAGLPAWILHSLGAVAAVSSLLALKSLAGAQRAR